jgi:hypothetical protein
MGGRPGQEYRARGDPVARLWTLPLLQTHLPEPAAQPLLELLERQDAVGERKYAVHPTVKRLISLTLRSIETPQLRVVS